MLFEAQDEGATIKQLLNLVDRRLDEIVISGQQAQDVESEEEILEHVRLAERVLSKTRFRLNSRRSINRLPVELLAHIFSLCQHAEAWAIFPPTFKEELCQHAEDWSIFPPACKEETLSMSSWLRLTEVCIHWRRTALSEPSLWARIFLPIRSHNQAEVRNLFLQRAGSCALEVYQHLNPESFDFYHLPQSLAEILSFAERHSTQLKSLYISSPQMLVIRSEFWNIFRYRYPQLQNLHLDVTSDDYSPVADLLHDLFQDELCRIRRLSLTYIPWPTRPEKLVHLTHLSLRSQAPHHTPSYHVFLDMLESCCHLQYLTLHDSGPLTIHAEVVRGRKVSLPSLRRIEFSWSDDPSICSPGRLLDHLDLPLEAVVFLHSRYMFNHDFLPALLEHLPPKRFLDPISTLELRKTGDTGILLQGQLMYIDNLIRHDTYLQRLAPHFPNLQNLIFAHSINVDASNISMFYTPSQFRDIRFIYPTNFVHFVEALCHPDSGPRCPSPSVIRVPSTSVDEMSKRHPMLRTKFRKYRGKESFDIERKHLLLPPIQLLFEQESIVENTPSLDDLGRNP